jgi:hypothetical protein
MTEALTILLLPLHAAKHAGAFVYSPAYRKIADALSEKRLSSHKL